MKIIYNVSILISLSMMLTACQLTTYQADEMSYDKIEISYSSYYLWLKSLSSAELLLEIKQQENRLSSTEQNDYETLQRESKLLLIYSLSTPAVYRPYKAKALLNKFLLPDNASNKANINTDTNLAFMVMLKDQLNSQLHLLNKQTKLEALFQSEQTKKNAEIIHLKKQLRQLKAIEKNISGHTLVNDPQ